MYVTDELVEGYLGDLYSLVVNVAKKQPADEYIGRAFAGRAASIWGNPFPLKSNTLRARYEAIAAFWEHLERSEELLAAVSSLSGRSLGCWCAPKACHGHLLALASNKGMVETVALHGALTEAIAAAPRRLLVTGDRHWKDPGPVHAELEKVLARWGGAPVLVVGDMTGVDTLALEFWKSRGLPFERYEADWRTLGDKAGPVRNAAMIKSTADGCIAFPTPVSKGTKGCAAAAKKAGIPVLEVPLSMKFAPKTRVR